MSLFIYFNPLFAETQFNPFDSAPICDITAGMSLQKFLKVRDARCLYLV